MNDYVDREHYSNSILNDNLSKAQSLEEFIRYILWIEHGHLFKEGQGFSCKACNRRAKKIVEKLREYNWSDSEKE